MAASLSALFATGGGPPVARQARDIPAIVFVSRRPAANAQIPGLGPHGRTLATGGRLLVRERGGRTRALVPESRFFDVADPCVAWDGKRVVFAATETETGAWRIWAVGADGKGLAAVTRDDRDIDLASARLDPVRFARYDDFDPVWLPDGRICFASTRFPQRAQADDVPVSNLFVIGLDGGAPIRITAERNGGEEPSVEPADGRLLYARWWFNRYLPTDLPPGAGLPPGITLDAATSVPQDTINLWAAGTILPDGDGVRLGAGDPRVRAHMRAHQPVRLAGGDVVGVWAEPASFIPAPSRLGLMRFKSGVGVATLLTGPGTEFEGAACSPAALSDGRILFAGDAAGRGDFAVVAMRADGRLPAIVIDLPGTHELDPTPIVSRLRPAVAHEEFTGLPTPGLPHVEPHQVADISYTFRFDCLNVFTNGDVDAPIPNAPRAQQGLRIRFYAALARPETMGGDSLVLLREVPIDASGAIHVDDIIAETPVFEQLVDAEGRVLRAARGPTHVPGFNFARMGAGTKCVGCHTGHSVLPVPANNWRAKWFNAAPSADIWASSQSGGPAQQIVDRRARGPAREVGWVATGIRDERVRLSWQVPIEVRAVVLYAVGSDPHTGTQLRVRETQLLFMRARLEVKRLTVRRTLSPGGTRVECEPVRVDAIEIVPTRVSGIVDGRPAVALAEVETIARLIED